MKRASHFVFGVGLCCCVFFFAQTTPVPTQEKQEPAASSSEWHEQNQSRSAQAGGNVGILSDTTGVRFRPYLGRVLADVRRNWADLLPDSARAPIKRKGKVCIEFTILKDGSVSNMKVAEPSGDASLDRAALEAITASNPFVALPKKFSGQYLALRFHFYYNPDVINIWPSAAVVYSGLLRTVSISAGTSQNFALTVNGEGTTDVAAVGAKDAAVKWSVVGSGCEGEACGTISDGGIYTAPIKVPDPPFVTVTAALESDPSKTDSVSVEIVRQDSPP